MGALGMDSSELNLSLWWERGVFSLPWQIGNDSSRGKKKDRDHLKIVSYNVSRVSALLKEKIERGGIMFKDSKIGLHHVSILICGICRIHRLQTNFLHNDFLEFLLRVNQLDLMAPICINAKGKATLQYADESPFKDLIYDFISPSSADRARRATRVLYNEPLDFNFEAEPREIAVRADDFLLREELPLSQLAAIGSLLPVDGFHNVIIDLSDQNQGLNRPSLAISNIMESALPLPMSEPVLPPDTSSLIEGKRKRRTPRKTGDPSQMDAVLREIMNQAFPGTEQLEFPPQEPQTNVQPPLEVLNEAPMEVQVTREMTATNAPRNTEFDIFTGEALASVPIHEALGSPKRPDNTNEQDRTTVRDPRTSMPLEPLLDQSEVKRLPKRRKAGKGNLIVDQQIMINLSTFEEYLSDRNRFAGLSLPVNHILLDSRDLMKKPAPGRAVGLSLRRMFNNRFMSHTPPLHEDFDGFEMPRHLPPTLHPPTETLRNQLGRVDNEMTNLDNKFQQSATLPNQTTEQTLPTITLSEPEVIREANEQTNLLDERFQVTDQPVCKNTPLEGRDLVPLQAIDPRMDGSLMETLNEPTRILPADETQVVAPIEPVMAPVPIEVEDEDKENKDAAGNRRKRKERREADDGTKKKRKPLGSQTSQESQNQTLSFVSVTTRFHLPTRESILQMVDEGLNNGLDNFHGIFKDLSRPQAATAFGFLLDMQRNRMIKISQSPSEDGSFGNPRSIKIARMSM
ncbi:uncharacterized protein LOC136041251 [Artemia franciscana]|uniref:Uncharacterized protein n=1 Tax=Artemia franciscana TaxID=6661 RepID=A0AA88H652_ARTSF|nr:hypothetical protein QYM36_017558 [Artemia franciscana]